MFVINVIFAGMYLAYCFESVGMLVLLALNSLNGVRIIRRVNSFSNDVRSIAKSLLLSIQASLMVMYILLLSTIIAYSIFKNTIQDCSLTAFSQPISQGVVYILTSRNVPLTMERRCLSS